MSYIVYEMCTQVGRILYLYTVSLIDRTAADLGSWVVACDYQMRCL